MQSEPQWVLSGSHLSSACHAGAGRGRSSGVERNLAKVEVVSSNLIARSNYLLRISLGPPEDFLESGLAVTRVTLRPNMSLPCRLTELVKRTSKVLFNSLTIQVDSPNTILSLVKPYFRFLFNKCDVSLITACSISILPDRLKYSSRNIQ